jgi:hypothetical protein
MEGLGLDDVGNPLVRDLIAAPISVSAEDFSVRLKNK